ncbi:MAG TPA: outer membrane beta-barrel protein, partial [Sphingobium sp.]|nr:outer membrane beta-barrel protein [Sphingobium sp.]
MALATTVMASPSLAKDKSWYVGADIGAMLVEGWQTSFSNGVTANTSRKTGYDADVNFGYDFGTFRLEAEYAHKKANNKATSFSNSLAELPGGMVRVDSVMLNGLVDVGPDDGVQGFFGGGIGVARSRISLPTTRDSDSGLAWQLLAGLRLPVTERVDVSLKYRLFMHPNIHLVSDTALNAKTSVRSHSALLGIAYNFG